MTSKPSRARNTAKPPFTPEVSPIPEPAPPPARTHAGEGEKNAPLGAFPPHADMVSVRRPKHIAFARKDDITAVELADCIGLILTQMNQGAQGSLYFLEDALAAQPETVRRHFSIQTPQDWPFAGAQVVPHA